MPRGRVEGGWGLFIFAGGGRPEGAQSVKIIWYTRAQNKSGETTSPPSPCPPPSLAAALSSQINFRVPFPVFPLSGFQLLETRVSGLSCLGSMAAPGGSSTRSHRPVFHSVYFLSPRSRKIHMYYTHSTSFPNIITPRLLYFEASMIPMPTPWAVASLGTDGPQRNTYPYTCNTVTSCSASQVTLASLLVRSFPFRSHIMRGVDL